MQKIIEDYPLVLTANHISKILSISKSTAYELMEDRSFPLIRLGRSKRVTQNDFFEWLSQQRANVS